MLEFSKFPFLMQLQCPGIHWKQRGAETNCGANRERLFHTRPAGSPQGLGQHAPMPWPLLCVRRFCRLRQMPRAGLQNVSGKHTNKGDNFKNLLIFFEGSREMAENVFVQHCIQRQIQHGSNHWGICKTDLGHPTGIDPTAAALWDRRWTAASIGWILSERIETPNWMNY